MADLHWSVIAVVLYFHLPGSAGTESQRILRDTHHHSDCRWDGECSLNCSFTGISAVPEDTSQTAVTADFSYNNIKTFVCADGRNEDWVVKHLNLSHNLISELSLTACRNLPLLETLDLSGNAIRTLTLGRPTPARASRRQGPVHRLLPALKVLSAERNNLSRVPRGLGLLQSLQTVHLSSNGIRQIDREDFQSCSQLKDIALQNNRITKIHPDAFRDLSKLQVVDLRANALTAPLPQLLISLSFFQLEVDLSNNAWLFNCRLNAFKHFFHFIFDSARQKWSIISYNKSASSSQTPLLYLSSSRVSCSGDVRLERAVIPPGRTSVLSCDLASTRGDGVSWWTPKGRISKGNSLPHMALDKRNNLVIYNADKTAEGLYLCILNTAKEKHLIYNIQVKERVSTLLVRKARDATTAFRQGRTEQDLALAVCLSVLVTFVCAFCLGAFARPYLVSLWRLARRTKRSGSERAYANRGFSDDALSRERSASESTNPQRHLFIRDEHASRNTCVLPTETSVLRGSGVHAPNTEEEYQRQSNEETPVKKNPVFSDTKTSIGNGENINVDNNGLFSVRIDDTIGGEVMGRKLISNDISLWADSNHANDAGSEKSRLRATPRRSSADARSHHTDTSGSVLSFMGESGSPFSTTQTPAAARDSRSSKVSDSSGLLRSESAKATPERKGIVSHSEPTSATEFMPGRQSCDEQLGLNSHINITSDVGDFVLPSSSKRDTNAENLSVYRPMEHPPLTGYGCKMELTSENGASADLFGDSSSDEGTPFTMSDCSSLEDFELEEPRASDKADTNSGTEKFSTPPEPPNVAAGHQRIEEDEEENKVCCETAIRYGSDTTMPETAPPYAEKRSDRGSMSDSDAVSSSSHEVLDPFDYFTNEESRGQNSDSPHNPDFGDTLLSLKCSPTYDTDTENTPEEAELQLYRLRAEPRRSLRLSPTEQKEDAPEGSPDEPIDGNSSDQDRGEGDITLSRNTSTSEHDDFTFAPSDIGLNEIVAAPSLPRPSTESSLQSLPEDTAEKRLAVVTGEEDPRPQEKQVNTTKARADEMQRGLNEKDWAGYTALQDASTFRLPDGTWSRNAVADWLHPGSPGRSASVSSAEDPFQRDGSDEDARSSSVPQGFFSESARHSSRSFPQKATQNAISTSSDSSEAEHDPASTALENNSAPAANLPHSSEKLSQRGQTTHEPQKNLKSAAETNTNAVYLRDAI
ncbi:leucine-rich repeat-containing protein 66 isoform X2 [Opisthocomus hoazin]|uniref:leucine-rich repeat-containing protein 66 isoform X2 n=1 Tax=Opisthocomus hoazin TaxID=30419 RepID=UPI003F534374